MLPTDAYWNRDPALLMADLGTGRDGLSVAEAARRLRQLGPNAVEDGKRLSAVAVFLRQFQSPLVLILVFGAIISLTLGDWIDAAIILAIVLGSTILGFAQEYRASTAIVALRQRLALTAEVRRGGLAMVVPASTIVPGDLVCLSAGKLVPADGIVIEARDFLVSEASLTGESFPVEKQPGPAPAQAPLAGRINSVFLGTSVRSGTATVVVVRTGRTTEFGAVAARLRTTPPETEFARGVRQFGYLLLRVMLVMVLFTLTVNLLLGRPTIDSLLFAVALAVGLSPELLPAIVNVTLAAGARHMARRGVVVRRLEAIDNLGSIDVLCTDKTGTITEGVVVLAQTVDPEGRPSAAVARLAYINAALETGIDNPLDAALVAAGKRDGLSVAGLRKIDEIPYDFRRKRLTIVVADDADLQSHLIIVKGAFSQVLDICTAIDAGGEVILDDAMRLRLEAFYRAKGSEGFRVLALAVKRCPPKDRYEREDEAGMSFAGFLLFFDPPKTDAAKTIADLAALGIKVKIVTGDNRFVAAHVAGAIGLDPRAMLTGEELAGLRDEALWSRAERTDLFVEVDPQQKERIVRALQRRGHAVGYLGDGINDAPALHAADIGISVEGAADAARESADVILLERDLDVLRAGVEDGRRTFANTLKYISITTSANFGNMVSMALAAPFLPFLPLAAKQILLNNFLSDLPSMAISTDRVDAVHLVQAQRWHVGEIRAFMIAFGLLSTVFDLLTFGILLYAFQADQAQFQTAWFVASLLTELAVVMVLRTQGPALASVPSRLLLWTTLAVVGLCLASPYIGPLARLFDFVPLPGPVIGAVIAVAAAYLSATEAAKLRFFRSRPLRAGHPEG